MKIRYAEVFDAPSLVKINCEAWQIAYANLIPDEILQKTDNIESHINGNDDVSLSAVGL